MITPCNTGDVLCEQQGAVLLVTLNRPHVMNSLTLEMDSTYRRLLSAADSDPDVRAIVVTGAGRAFCAGADIAMLEKLVDDPDRPHFGPEFIEPLALSKPLIAAINGACAGLGVVAAMLCDVRFMAAEAKLLTAFAQRGVIAEHGLAALLTQNVGRGNAMDLLLSSRIIDGTEAGRIGLAQHVVPRTDLLDAAMDYARALADTCAPGSVALMKSQFRQALTAAFHDEAQASHGLLREIFRGPDYAEGIHSYQEHRTPEFSAYSAP